VYRRPLIGVLPRAGEATPVRDGVPVIDAALREPFRSLRVNVDLAAIDRDLKILTVVSAVPEEGKSTVIRNLALAYAEAGLRVAVVESDLRKPMLSRTFNVEPRPGLTDVLASQASVDQALKRIRTSHRSLVPAGAPAGDESPSETDNGGSVGNGFLASGGTITVLTAGPEPPNPPVLLASDPFRSLVDDLVEGHDMVLLDTAPLLVIADAVPLVEMADGVLIVTRFGRTTRDAAKRLTTVLDRVPDVNVLGVVANGVPSRDIGSGTYSYYGYTSDKQD
jgi:Mrp family chromosome partitioning ATPase